MFGVDALFANVVHSCYIGMVVPDTMLVLAHEIGVIVVADVVLLELLSPAVPEEPECWARSYLLALMGWVRDGGHLNLPHF